MKKLMFAAAAAVLSAMGAKAEWMININDSATVAFNAETKTSLDATVDYRYGMDLSKYTQCYVMMTSDWDGTFASLGKNISKLEFNARFSDEETLRYQTEFSGSPARDVTFRVSGGSTVKDVDADQVVAIVTDNSGSGYFELGMRNGAAIVSADDGALIRSFAMDFEIDIGWGDQPKAFAPPAPAPIPEPTSGLLLLLGVAGLALRRRRA